MCQEVEDEKKRQEQEARLLGRVEMARPMTTRTCGSFFQKSLRWCSGSHWLLAAEVDQADDEVEKALITHEILATCDED